MQFSPENMGDFKLAYFDGRGRAEVLRLTLAAGGKKFEDCRWDGAQFQKEKDSELEHRFFVFFFSITYHRFP